VPSSTIGSVLERKPGSVLGSVSRAKLGVCNDG